MLSSTRSVLDRCRASSRLPAVVTASVFALAATGCSGSSADAAAVTVASSDTACDVAPTQVPAGKVAFSVTNTGSAETEFYVYAADGTTVVAEVEHIGPGLTRELSADLKAGEYVTACKPGMKGDGIRGKFTAAG